METPTTPQPQQVPDILTQANRERFNRRVRVGSLILGYLLICVMIGAGYMQYSQHKEIGKNYCYACGLFEGKQCTTKYFTEQELKSYGADKLRQDLADSNGK